MQKQLSLLETVTDRSEMSKTSMIKKDTERR